MSCFALEYLQGHIHLHSPKAGSQLPLLRTQVDARDALHGPPPHLVLDLTLNLILDLALDLVPVHLQLVAQTLLLLQNSQQLLFGLPDLLVLEHYLLLVLLHLLLQMPVCFFENQLLRVRCGQVQEEGSSPQVLDFEGQQVDLHLALVVERFQLPNPSVLLVQLEGDVLEELGVGKLGAWLLRCQLEVAELVLEDLAVLDQLIDLFKEDILFGLELELLGLVLLPEPDDFGVELGDESEVLAPLPVQEDRVLVQLEQLLFELPHLESGVKNASLFRSHT